MPFTSQTDLVSGHQVKFGTAHGSLDASYSVLEANIAKALLSDGAGATTAVADFRTLTSTETGNNPNSTHYLSSAFDKDNIQIELNTDVSYRNMAIVANYESNEDITEFGETTNSVVIDSDTTINVTSKVLDDSSAYSNATARFTITDPYFTDPSFGNGNYECAFDTSDISKYVATRNVNTNDAHNNKLASITVGDYVSWNTDGSCGSYFVNGVVSFDGTTGEPIASLYADDASLNLLNKNFAFSCREDQANAIPDFGRYYVTYSTGGSNQSRIAVDICGNSSLVVTSDLAQWTAFMSNIDASLNTQVLPTSLTTNEIGSFVGVGKSALDGFLFRIESNVRTSELSLVNNQTSSGLTFDLSDFVLPPKEMYILEQSIQDGSMSITDASLSAVGNSTLSSPTISGETYNNRLRIINGGLSLAETDDVISNYIQLLDGNESLDINNYDTNGLITVYTSARVSSSTDTEDVFPRASRTSVSETYPILNNLAVQYTSSDLSYVEIIGTITGADLTDASVNYAVSTLVGQTYSLDFGGSDNWTNIIDDNNGAIAIVKDSNSTINASDINFYSNTNTYTDGSLSIVDLTCNKVWSESKVYDNTDTQIAGVTADIKSTNMPSDFTLKDIRLALEARPLSDLSLSSVDASWSITTPDVFLKSSAGKLGVIDDSDIVDLLLGGDESTIRALSIDLKPNVTSVEAHKFTKFHNQIEITYGSAKQITYDDEFQIVGTAVEGTPDKTLHSDVEITTYTHLPANTKLYKRSYTESFKVKIPFRFGNYTNLFLTTPTISQKVEYYVLTDNSNNNADLPRYFLRDVRDGSNNAINATISGVTGHPSTTWSTTINFKNNDFRTHHIVVQKLTGGNWVDQALAGGAHVDSDLWYNTRSTLPTDGIGTFNVALTLSPDLIIMDRQYLYVDMELEKGITSFTLSGKRFTSAQVDALGNVNLNTFNFNSSTGETIEGTLTYVNDNNASPNTQAYTTLSGAGYTFKIQGNLYLSIRVIACPNGIFKCIKTGGDSAGTTYHYIETIDEEISLDLTGTGVYGYGDLRSAIRGTSTATWSLNNSAISAIYYGETGFNTQRITSLNQEFRPDDDRRGFKTTVLRGLKPDEITIYRTPSQVNLELAGVSSGNLDLYTGMDLTNIFDIGITSGNDIVTMYSSTATEEDLTWSINLTYGYYKITERETTDASLSVIYVASYFTKLSDRYSLKIVNTTVNTNLFSYQIQFFTSTSLEFYRNPDILAPNYSDNSGGYVIVNSYTVAQLTDPSYNKFIGNILNLSYGSNTISNLTGQFCIVQPYLKFTAIDPSGIISLPFDSEIPSVMRYLSVDNSNNTYNPFSSHPRINNISFSQAETRNYLDYVNEPEEPIGMDVHNNKISVSLATGLYSEETDTGYTSFYPSTTISTTNNVANEYLTINFLNDKLYINMNQHKKLDSFFTFDESFNEYNLQTEIGSIFISDPNDGNYDGSVDINLEFKSGDCTKLDLYSIETIRSGPDDTIEAVFEKYSTDAGIDNQFLNKVTPYGLAIPWNTRYTNTVSVAKSSGVDLTSTRLTLDTLLSQLRTASTSSVFETEWVEEVPDNYIPRLALIPNNLAGSNSLKRFFTLSPQIPRALIMLQLEDHQRLTDTFGFPKYRVTFSGAVQSQASNLEPAVIRAENNGYSIADQIKQNYPTLTRN